MQGGDAVSCPDVAPKEDRFIDLRCPCCGRSFDLVPEDSLALTFPGRPVPAARMTRNGKWVRPDAQRYLAYKEEIGWRAREVVKDILLGPLAVAIKAYYGGGKAADVDNLAKSILDACNMVVWNDDTQIEELHIYRRIGKPQRAEMRVWRPGVDRGEEIA